MTSVAPLSTTDPLSALLQASSSAPASSTSPVASTSAAPPAAVADISGPGRVFALLQQLQQADPAKFKQVTAQIASQLKAAAQQQGSGGNQLAQLADRFQKASQTGDVSSLAGAQGGQRPHHHHGTYNRSGQPVTATTDSTNETSLKQIFGSIADNLSSVLG